jgi:hypothetical protein
MAEDERRIALDGAFDYGHRVFIRAEKTRERLLEMFERKRVLGRRDQSKGVG